MTKKEWLLKCISGANWKDNDIDQIVERAIAPGGPYDDPDFKRKSFFLAVKEDIRKTLRNCKDEQGLPLVPSIKRTDENGDEKEYYKQLKLFEPDDYLQLCNYHIERGKHHYKMALEYYKHCYKKYGIQLAIQFPNMNEVA